MTTELSNPHDLLFRALIESPSRGAELLRSHLPDKVLDLIADRPFERLPESFIDANLRMHLSDGLFRTETSEGEEAYLYVLMEHKPAHDPWIPLQVARYVLCVWEWHSRQSFARPGVLPPVILVLIFHGRGHVTCP